MALIDDYYFMVLCGVIGLLLCSIALMCILKVCCKCFDIVDDIDADREQMKQEA